MPELPDQKGKIEDVNKESNNKSTIPGELLMIDISYVHGRNQGKKKVKGNCFWLLFVDKATSMKWSYFMLHKEYQVKMIINLVKALRAQKPGSIKYIKCNNAGEKKHLKRRCKMKV